MELCTPPTVNSVSLATNDKLNASFISATLAWVTKEIDEHKNLEEEEESILHLKNKDVTITYVAEFL